MAESIRDQRHYRPASVDDIEREFPGWHAWRGVNTRYYARLSKTSPPVVVCGAEDLAEVRELILERLSRPKVGRRDGGSAAFGRSAKAAPDGAQTP